MKKLGIILSLFFLVQLAVYPANTKDSVSVKTELKCDSQQVIVPVITGVISELMNDSLARQEAIAQYQNAKNLFFYPPVKGSSWWTWFKYIAAWIGVIGFINGLITRAIPTPYKQKYKWWRWTEMFVEAVLFVVKIMPNRSINPDGTKGKHKD